MAKSNELEAVLFAHEDGTTQRVAAGDRFGTWFVSGHAAAGCRDTSPRHFGNARHRLCLQIVTWMFLVLAADHPVHTLGGHPVQSMLMAVLCHSVAVDHSHTGAIAGAWSGAVGLMKAQLSLDGWGAMNVLSEGGQLGHGRKERQKLKKEREWCEELRSRKLCGSVVAEALRRVSTFLLSATSFDVPSLFGDSCRRQRSFFRGTEAWHKGVSSRFVVIHRDRVVG